MNYKVVVIGLLLIALPFGLLFAIPPAEGEYQGKTASQWIALTKTGSSADKASAAKALGVIGKTEYESVKGTRAALMIVHDKFGGERCYATMVPPLIALLRDPDQSVRSSAVDALAELGEYSDDEMQRAAADLRDQMVLWGVYLVYLREARLGRNTQKVLDTQDGRRMLEYTQGDPHPDYLELIDAERALKRAK